MSDDDAITVDPIPDAPEPEQAIIPKPKKNGGAEIELAGSSIVLSNLEELLRFAQMVYASGLAPKDMDARGIAVAIQAGAELGLSIMTSVRSFVVLKGNLSLKGEAALALLRGPRGRGVLVPGSLKHWVEGEGDDMRGVCVSRRVGYDEAFRTEFSMADAKAAGLALRDNWKAYRNRMLGWRAIGHHAKDYYSDVIGGYPLAEEVVDWRPSGRGETPATRVGPPPVADPLLEAIEIEAEPIAAEDVPEAQDREPGEDG